MSRPRRAPPNRRGYTLVELTMVVTVLGILCMIAIPKIGAAIRIANEGATKGKLGAVRTALGIYYADTEGSYPSNLDPLMQPGSKYLTQVVPLYTAAHGNATDIHYLSSFDDSDSGGWGYINTSGDWGRVWIQCTHSDASGEKWSQR